MASKRRIVIPARYASTRLPGKMLLEIAEKPMLQHVYERSLACGFDSVLIATDDQRIYDAATSWGAHVCWTDIHHPSGTDRIAEAFQQQKYQTDDIIVGVQGDEPLIPIENIIQVAHNLELYPDAAMTSLCEPLHTAADILSSHRVKVVRDKNGYALYFSRSPIPWQTHLQHNHNLHNEGYFVHVGIYCYRGNFLQQYAQLARCPLEQYESLEQLRVLWHGYKLHVDVAQVSAPPGVDTAEGLEFIRQQFKRSMS